MGRGIRLVGFGIGMVALALAAPPAVAQDATASNTAIATNTPVATEIVGPPQLRDFNLNGTVTRQAIPPTTDRAAPPPATQTTRASPQPNSPNPAPRSAATGSGTASATGPATIDLPPQTPVPQPQFEAPIAAPVSGRPLGDNPAMSLPADEPGESNLPSIWPWLLAALVAAGGALLLFRRHQQSGRYAVAGAGLARDLAPRPEPKPAPEQLRRAPAAAPPRKPNALGVVSSRLRPDLDIELVPERAVVDDTGATIEFHVAVRNTGSAPARDVRVQACMVNAGPAQDQELGAFFAHPVAAGRAIPQILPMTEITLKSTVRLAPEHMRQFEIAGRKLFVPLVGVNALYRGPAGPAQTSASYLVGRDGNGEKMAPFRLDLGPRIFRGLGVRQHTAGLRT